MVMSNGSRTLAIIRDLDYSVIGNSIEFFRTASPDISTVLVSSGGGDLDVAFSFVDLSYRKRISGKLNTIGIGEVCSGACLIVAAGSPGERTCYPHTLWGLHEPYLEETTPDPAVLANEIKLLQSNTDRFYTLLGKLTSTYPGVWRRRLKGKSMVYFDAKQAKRWKLVDYICT